MYDYDSRAKLRNNEFNYEQIMNIIKEVPCYIECVGNQTEELQWIAIKRDYWSYQYIINPTPEMTEYCLNQNGHIIQFIDNPTEEQIKKAINKNWMSIVHIKKPSLDICKYAFKISRQSADYMPEDMANIVRWQCK